MKHITINQKVILEIRKRVWKKAGSEPLKNNDKVIAALGDRYTLDGPFSIKLKSYTKSFNKSKRVGINSEPYELFIIFCNYLGVSVEKYGEGEYSQSTKEIIEELYRLTFISKKLYDNQLASWQANDTPKSEHFYACYYSKGSAEPDVALLTIDSDWKTARLEFYRKERSTHHGTINHQGLGSNVFITLRDIESKFDSILSLKKNKSSDVEQVKRFDGFYCSALSLEDGNPVAGRLILIKIEESEQYLIELGGYDTMPFLELHNERLVYDIHYALNAKLVENYASTYIGYWFLVKDETAEIRQMAVEIGLDGRCKLIDSEKKEVPGFIRLIDESTAVLKLGFDPAEDHQNFRVNIVLDTSTMAQGFLDGVYSGQRLGWGKIMGGRIRFYKSKDKFQTIDTLNISFDEAVKELPEIGADLLSFFWGDDDTTKSYNYIQPNLFTYEQLKNPLMPQNHSAEDTVGFRGNYTLVRMDSERKRINQFSVDIDETGYFTYQLKLPKRISIYTGNIFWLQNCLMLNVTLKNNRSYHALYIFFKGGKRIEDISFLTGVYAAVSAGEDSPICGRAVLIVNKVPIGAEPVEIGSDKFFKLDQERHGMMQFLSVEENNFVKSRRVVDSFSREIRYGNVFFVYACHYNLSESKRLFFVKHAFENGFNELKSFTEMLAENQPLNYLNDHHKLEINKEQNWFKITITYQSKPWEYTGSTKVYS